MTKKASICTIGDEILIGQIVDTNSSMISRALGELGIKTDRMVSIGDDREDIVRTLGRELENNDIVISTGGLGPTKDDITKDALKELSGSAGYRTDETQKQIVYDILHSRGLDVLESNIRQADVPDKAEVIPNKVGTAPIMVFRFNNSTLYALPGVPYEAQAALPFILDDIRAHNRTEEITHRTVMTFGMAESALARQIEGWESALPADMHLAYLPNLLTGVRLRLSIYGGDGRNESRMNEEIGKLKAILGDTIYSFEDSTLESTIGKYLRGTGKTIAVAESCTGGMISHLITSVPGASEYYLGSVTSYAVPVKQKLLGVKQDTIDTYGIVSAEVAAAMAEGVRALCGSTYSVATTGWADKYGDEHEPAGTVWVGVSGPTGTVSARFNFRHDRKRNIERFASSALNELRKYIESDL